MAAARRGAGGGNGVGGYLKKRASRGPSILDYFTLDHTGDSRPFQQFARLGEESTATALVLWPDGSELRLQPAVLVADRSSRQVKELQQSGRNQHTVQ